MAKILLIDDSEVLLRSVEHVLSEGGHVVHATTCGASAVEKFRDESFDLVLTDMYMPPPDGFEIIQTVRAMNPRIPFIVMSTNPLACDVFRAARALGAIATLQKPFSGETLLNAVQAALARPLAKAAPVSQRASTR